MTIGLGVGAGWNSYRLRATLEITESGVFVNGCKIIKQRNVVNGVLLHNAEGKGELAHLSRVRYD
jgi:hypothetical protein